MSFRDGSWLEGPHLRALWLSVERVAQVRFSALARFITLDRDAGVSPREEHHDFLSALGYQPMSGAGTTFVKEMWH